MMDLNICSECCSVISNAILLYGLEALPLNKSQLSSLDFMLNRFLMKLYDRTEK